MRIAKFILPVFLFFHFLSQAQKKIMLPEEIAHFKTEIAQRTTNLKTLSGEFLQKKHMAFLQNDIESSGRFYFVAPDKIKWAYANPYRYSVIFKNGKIFIDNEGEKNTIDIGKNKLLDKLNKLIVNSINGKMLESNDFKIMYHQNADYFIANLLPTDPVVLKLFKEIVLTFDKTDYKIHRVKLVEPSDDYTQIYFTKLKTNAPIEDSVFRL